MKDIITSFLTVFVFLTTFWSCSQTNTIILRDLDYFSDNSKNIQLGKDLVNYFYPFDIEKKIPENSSLNSETVEWVYFISDIDQSVSFRLKLKGDAKKFQEELTELFKTLIDNQIQQLVYNENKLNIFIKFSNEVLKDLDSNAIDEFIKNCSDDLKQTMKISEFENIIINRSGLLEKLGDRYLDNKQYYHNFPGLEGKGFYVFNFSYSKDEYFKEQLIISEESQKIMSYDTSVKK